MKFQIEILILGHDIKESNYEDWSKINYGIMLDWQNFRGANESIKLKFRKGYKEHYNITYISRSLGKEQKLFRRE